MCLCFTDNWKYDLCVQQRIEEMESEINDLRDEIEAVKNEKTLLEKQTQIESEVNIVILLKFCFSVWDNYLKLYNSVLETTHQFN